MLDAGICTRLGLRGRNVIVTLPAMGYPERLLSDDEVIASEFRPHWSSILREILLATLAFVLIGLLAANDLLPAWLLLVLVIAAIALIARGLTTWLTTIHVVTNERVVYRAGWISKRGKEIPLEVINDVAFKQSVFERVFRTGDLMIESAGTHGQSRYRDIPDPEGVQSLIYDVRETRMADMRSSGTSPAHAESAASQLETMSRLHDQGKLTDQEFDDQKRKLLEE